MNKVLSFFAHYLAISLIYFALIDSSHAMKRTEKLDIYPEPKRQVLCSSRILDKTNPPLLRCPKDVLLHILRFVSEEAKDLVPLARISKVFTNLTFEASLTVSIPRSKKISFKKGLSIIEKFPQARRVHFPEKIKKLEELKILVATLTNLSHLQDLDLNSNYLGPDKVKMCTSLTCLIGLDMDFNDIEDEGAISIAQSLTGLLDLSLSHNNIGAEGTDSIARSLTRLIKLNLKGNEIGSDGAESIAQFLTNLTYLDLESNSIGAKATKNIAKCLTKLRSLNLEENNIGDWGTKNIARCLTNLTYLNLSHNNISAKGTKNIAQCLTNLTSLELLGNNIGSGGRKILRKWQQRNPMLYVRYDSGEDSSEEEDSDENEI